MPGIQFQMRIMYRPTQCAPKLRPIYVSSHVTPTEFSAPQATSLDRYMIATALQEVMTEIRLGLSSTSSASIHSKKIRKIRLECS